jgi:hypothetical protein
MPPRSRRCPRVYADAPAFTPMPPRLRRCPRVYAVGVSPSPYAPAHCAHSHDLRVRDVVVLRAVGGQRSPRSGRPSIALGQSGRAERAWTRPRVRCRARDPRPSQTALSQPPRSEAATERALPCADAVGLGLWRARCAPVCVICSRPRVEDGCPVERRLLSSSALLSPLSILLSRAAQPPRAMDARPFRPKKSGDEVRV